MSRVLAVLDSERLTAFRLSRPVIALESATAASTMTLWVEHGGLGLFLVGALFGQSATLSVLQAWARSEHGSSPHA